MSYPKLVPNIINSSDIPKGYVFSASSNSMNYIVSFGGNGWVSSKNSENGCGNSVNINNQNPYFDTYYGNASPNITLNNNIFSAYIGGNYSSEENKFFKRDRVKNYCSTMINTNTTPTQPIQTTRPTQTSQTTRPIQTSQTTRPSQISQPTQPFAFNSLNKPEILYHSNIEIENNSTKFQPGTFVDGEWIQIQLPEPVYLTSYNIDIGNIGNNQLIKYTVLGSNNGIDWRNIHSKNNYQLYKDHDYSQNIYNETVTTYDKFSYFRLVISEIKVTYKNNGTVTINDWQLYGSSDFISSVPYNIEPFFCLSRQLEGFQNYF
jgi:hypothetical protein